jgi:hypothetical protein
MAEFTVHIPRLTKSMTRTQAVRRARVLAARGKVTVVGEPHVRLDWERSEAQYVVVFDTVEL